MTLNPIPPEPPKRQRLNAVIPDGQCPSCGPTKLRTQDDDMSVAVYKSGDVLVMFRCPRCSERQSMFLKYGTVRGTFVEIAHRTGTPVVYLPESEHPKEADFAPVDWDDLVDFHEQLDEEIAALLETGK